ncbi:hypothetical protein [Saccharothrix sp. ALI-22-I]|nr:hypothetical protein [Saccharothrix sp. ALI-22-I]
MRDLGDVHDDPDSSEAVEFGDRGAVFGDEVRDAVRRDGPHHRVDADP